MNLLALDLASCTGFARQNDHEPQPEYGSHRFKGAIGSRALAFEDWLICNVHDDRVTHIAIEAPVPVMGNTNLDVLIWLYGAHTIVRKLAAKNNMRIAIVNVGTWRSFFTGHARAPKHDPKTGELLETPNNRRKWIKQATILECRSRGLDPLDDNAADAIGLLTYCRACLDPKNGIDPADLYAEAA